LSLTSILFWITEINCGTGVTTTKQGKTDLSALKGLDKYMHVGQNRESNILSIVVVLGNSALFPRGG
jgi:hypothetical protein